MTRSIRAGLFAGLALFPIASLTHAEPYLAVRSGFACVQCHANPTGGGLRNVYGNVYAQAQLAAKRTDPESEPWTGRLERYVALGGGVRANASWVGVLNQEAGSAFEVADARAFVEASLVPGRLSLYFDERVAPGGAQNMEANVRFWLREGSLYVKAGRIYLPFGWRLEDDGAFVRQLSGINMEVPDQGVELGVEQGHWSTQLAASNGSGGAAETDQGKQVTASAVYLRSAWRVGASAVFNDSDAGDRQGAALFSGVRLGPLSFLGEVDYIDDASLGTGGRELLAALAEVNWLVRAGHNVKVTHEWLEPDRTVDEDEQTRTSLLYEYSPIEFVQLRAGVRRYEGVPEDDLQIRTDVLVQLHGYF